MTDGAPRGGDDRAGRPIAERFLEGKTLPQRVLLAVGGLAGAMAAIIGLVKSVGPLFDGDDGPKVSSTGGAVVRIVNQSASADEFVRYLLDHEGRVVQLNHQVLGPKGSANILLEYACRAETGCVTARIEDGTVSFSELPDGRWWQGCYRIVKDGDGYGAEPLDIELHESGATCP